MTNDQRRIRRYFSGSWTESSILASPRFSSKSPVLLLVAVRLAPSVSEFAPALLLLAVGSCSTVQRRCVCRPPWPELAFASAFMADFALFPDPELLPSSSFELVLVEALLGLPSSPFELVLVEALLDFLSSSLDLVSVVEALPGLTV